MRRVGRAVRPLVGPTMRCISILCIIEMMTSARVLKHMVQLQGLVYIIAGRPTTCLPSTLHATTLDTNLGSKHDVCMLNFDRHAKTENHFGSHMNFNVIYAC